ncbi:zinc finger, CCHC-type containing protein [Tanacetum coccineum]
MSSNHEYVHLVWPLWSDLSVIPTHGKFCHRQNYGNFCTFLLGGLKSFASNAIKACRLPLALLVYTLVRPSMTTSVENNSLEHHIPAAHVAAPGQQVPPQALAAHAAWVKGSKEIAALMLMTMDLDIQQNLTHLGAYDMLQELKTTCFRNSCKPYIDNLERLGQPVSLRLAVSLILFSLSKEYEGFVQNYNMHNMGKTVNELHAMLKLHEQTLPKKDVAPCMQIEQEGITPCSRKDYPNKGHDCTNVVEVESSKNELSCLSPTSCEKGRSYLKEQELQGLRGSKKLKPGALSSIRGRWSSCNRDDIYVIDLSSFNTNDSSMYVVNNKRAKLNLDSSLLWHCRLGHISKKRVEKLQHDGLLNSTDIKSFEKCVSCMSGKMARKPYSHQVERVKDLLRLIHTDDYALESSVRILNMVPTKKVDKTPYEVWNGQAPRTRRAPDRMCLHVDAEEHELGDLEMQSMKDNKVWDLVDLPPNRKTVGSKWLFKKKTDMDGAVQTFKARLVAKGFTQTYGVDYEETFSPIVDIRAIRILIAIAGFYDYEIWQMDVKTAFLNGHLFEEVYIVKPEGEAAYILGIKIYRDRSKRLIGLCQSAYIEIILKRYFMENSKRGTIPMQEKLKLSKSQGASTPAEKKHMQNVPYASAVGSIVYALRCTRPDVAFAQNIKSQFQQNPSELH